MVGRDEGNERVALLGGEAEVGGLAARGVICGEAALGGVLGDRGEVSGLGLGLGAGQVVATDAAGGGDELLAVGGVAFRGVAVEVLAVGQEVGGDVLRLVV